MPQHGDGPAQYMFGPLLLPIQGSDSGRDVGESSDYDLIGSAGIWGHKAVQNDIPAYAPQSAPTPKDTAVAVPYLFDDRNAGVSGGVANYEALFFQADDFGRAIDEWMSFNEEFREG